MDFFFRMSWNLPKLLFSDSKYISTIAQWYQATFLTIQITSIQTLNQTLGGIQNKEFSRKDKNGLHTMRQDVDFWYNTCTKYHILLI